MIYKVTNNINGKVYIGQTKRSLNTRISNHKSLANKGSNYQIHRAIRKWGFDTFYWMVINQCDDIDTLNLLEQYYIEYFDSVKNGYNMTTGGRHSFPSKKTDEHIKKLRQAALNLSDDVKENRKRICRELGLSAKGKGERYAISEETRKKMRVAKKGRGSKGKNHWNYNKKLSPETKEKIRQKKLGGHHSEETKWKMSQTHLSINKKLKESVNSGSSIMAIDEGLA